ncbi:Kinetochore-associated protein 1 [Homalodisca vitripennis]|nr:Kinetochore-associated protein 1 [Homalodisca vitripennis]
MCLYSHTDINSVVLAIGQLHRVNVVGIQQELLSEWLYPADSPPLDSSCDDITQNIAAIHSGSTVLSDNDSIIRACYVLESMELETAAKYLVSYAGELECRPTAVRLRALQCLCTIATADIVVTTTGRTLDSIKRVSGNSRLPHRSCSAHDKAFTRLDIRAYPTAHLYWRWRGCYRAGLPFFQGDMIDIVPIILPHEPQGIRTLIPKSRPPKEVEASSEPTSPQEPLILKERNPPTPTVIPHSRLDLSNYPCTPESQHLQLVMCRSWTSISELEKLGLVWSVKGFESCDKEDVMRILLMKASPHAVQLAAALGYVFKLINIRYWDQTLQLMTSYAMVEELVIVLPELTHLCHLLDSNIFTGAWNCALITPLQKAEYPLSKESGRRVQRSLEMLYCCPIPRQVNLLLMLEHCQRLHSQELISRLEPFLSLTQSNTINTSPVHIKQEIPTE